MKKGGESTHTGVGDFILQEVSLKERTKMTGGMRRSK